MSNEVDGWDYGKKAILSGFIAFIGSKLVKNRFTDWREKLGLPYREMMPHHAHLGLPIAIAGVINYESPISPFLLGSGIGLVAEDYEDMCRLPEIKPLELKMRSIGKNKVGKDALPYEKWNVIEKKLPAPPPWVLDGRKWTYDQLAKLLRKFVVEDTYNKVTGEKVLAGYRHPAVVWTTRQVIQMAGADSYKPETVARAIHDWVKAKKTYIYDPEWKTNQQLGEDWFFHPHILLGAIHKGERGMVVGDCDDLTVLTASMLMSAGLEPAMVLYAQQLQGVYNHIVPAVVIDDEVIPMEVTQNKPFGWHPPHKSMGVIRF